MYIQQLQAAVNHISLAADCLIVPENVVMPDNHLAILTDVMETLHDEKQTLMDVVEEMKPPLPNLTFRQVKQALANSGEHSIEDDGSMLNCMYVRESQDFSGTHVYCIAYTSEETGHLEYASVYVRWDEDRGLLVANY